MATPRRSSLLNRAMSTPPTTPSNTASGVKTPPNQQMPFSRPVLTPPTSPHNVRTSSHKVAGTVTSPSPSQSPYSTNVKSRHEGLQPLQTGMVATHQQCPAEMATVPECPFSIEVLKDERGRDIYFGTGAWSMVYKATTRPKTPNVPTTPGARNTLTPPLSPTTKTPALVAVKKPTRRDATTILQSEAKTLCYLHTIPNSHRFIVPFYGIVDTSSLVLGAIPYSLEQHIRRRSSLESQQGSNWTSTEPMIGSTVAWLTLAWKLVSGLAWLHAQAGVVHGDIKPGNILLAPKDPESMGNDDDDTSFPYEPVFADFSSSQLLPSSSSPNPPVTPNTLSAITREFTAPELLSSAVLRDPTSTATSASDIFSLAVTLLVAATGQMLVYPGSVLQRQAMATQGWAVLGLVRNGEGGLRVPVSGVVERSLEGAVLRDPARRVPALQWVGVVEGVARAADGGRL